MEKHARDVAGMALQSVHLPVLVARKSPKLDCLVICGRRQNLHRRMERDPIDAFLVAIKDVFDFDLGSTHDFLPSAARLLHGQLFQLEEVPNANGLI